MKAVDGKRKIAALVVLMAILGVTTPSAATVLGHIALSPGAQAQATEVFSRGGPVMHQPTVYLIFWRPSGFCFEPSRQGSCGDDRRYMALIARYISDVGGTPFYHIITQYGDADGPIVNGVRLGGVVVDSRPYPHAGTIHDPLRRSDIEAEIGRVMDDYQWSPGLDALFAIFTAYGVASCDPQICTYTSPGYCAFHSAFSRAGAPIVYADMPDVGGIDGCPMLPSPNDTLADAEINALSHEQFEATTDPLLTGWADKDGQEIADRCLGVYGRINSDGSNIRLHGHPYLVQAEWSNADRRCDT